MTTGNIKVAGLIEFPIYRMGVEGVLKRFAGMEFLGNTTRKNASAFLNEHSADILLVSTKKSFAHHLAGFQKLHQEFPFVKWCFFLSVSDEEQFKEFADLPVNGLLLKSISLRELEYAIRTIYNSGFYLSQGISADVFNAFFNKKEERKAISFKEYKLGEKEIRIMHLIYQEYSTKAIAEKLNMSPRTVEAYRIRIMRKINVRSSIGIAKFMAKAGR